MAPGRLVAVALVVGGLLVGDGGAAGAADEPRWRVRGALMSGFGGSVAGGDSAAMFPTTLELGLRAIGPLSFDVGATGVLATSYETDCGEARRPHAILGSLGARIDFANGRSASWADPFLEAHGGIGSQGGCPDRRVFGTGGLRVGVDVWLGRSAVTAALGFDYLPTASPISFLLGLSRIFR
jgi:hypothetical protein